MVGEESVEDFGARPLRRRIEHMIEDTLAEELLKGEFQGKDTITIDVIEVAGKRQLNFESSVKAPEEPAVAAADSGSEEA